MVKPASEMLVKKATSIFNNIFRYQILATLAVHILTFSHGLAVGWLSPTLQLLQSSDTPLSFGVSVTQASWIGSLFALGALMGNILLGLLLDRLGRKLCLYVVALPHMCFWLLVFFAGHVEYLYVGRYLAGLTSGGLYVVAPIFISEIADPSVRGTLCSLTMLFLSFGIFAGFVLSTHIDYHVMPWIALALPLLFLITVSIFPDTPQYLIKSGNNEAAEKSYNFYKNIRSDRACEAEAQAVSKQFDELKQGLLKGTQCTPVTVKDFFTKAALRGFRHAFVLIALNQFSGTFAMVNYMSHIFALSSTSMDPNTCTIIMGIVQIVGTCLATLLVDRFGRKSLMLISVSGMALGKIVFGAFTQYATAGLGERFDWLPLVLMTFVMLSASIGVIGLMFTILVEVLPAKIRSKATSICMMSMSIAMFIALKMYPIFLNSLGIAVTMYSSAGVCLACMMYIIFCLPETKGKSIDFD